MLEKTCDICKEEFRTRFATQKRCPKCIDKSRGNPVTIKRECLHSWICNIHLPHERFEPFDTGEHRAEKGLRAIFKGKDSGYVAWEGRLDVYVNGENGSPRNIDGTPKIPEIGRVRLMQVTKQTGQVDCRENLPDIVYPTTYQYLAIDHLKKIPENVDGDLIYATGTTKTTIKGLGRQYWTNFDTEHCLYACEMYSAPRSGRIEAKIVICIVNEQNPLIRSFRENGTLETFYRVRNDVEISQGEFLLMQGGGI